MTTLTRLDAAMAARPGANLQRNLDRTMVRQGEAIHYILSRIGFLSLGPWFG